MREHRTTNRGMATPVETAVLASAVAALVLASASLAGGGFAPSADRGDGFAPSADSGDVGQDDEFEPNDEFATATELSPPFESGTLEIGPDDADVFAVDLARGDRLDVSVAFDHDDGDADLILYDPRRNAVASSLSITDDESASIRANENGTFHALVLSPTNDTVPYSITVEREAGEVVRDDALEPNDGFDSATNVSTSFARDDLRVVTYDRDLYAVELAGGSDLTVSARFDHNETDVDLRLYDRNRTVVAGSGTLTNEESISASVRTGGVYYVSVFSANDSSGAYSLSIRGSEPTPGETATTESMPGTSTTEARPDTDPPGGTGTESGTTDDTGPGSGQTTVASSATGAALATGTSPDTTATSATDGPGFTGFLTLLALGVVVASARISRGSPGHDRQ